MHCLNRKMLFILGCILLFLPAIPAFAQTAPPEVKAVQEVMKCCPPDAMAVIHVDAKIVGPVVREVLNDFRREMAKEEKNADQPPGLGTVVLNAEIITEIIETNFDRMNVFILPAEQRMPFSLLVAFQGDATKDNVIQKYFSCLQKIQSAMEYRPGATQAASQPALPEAKNGRYELPGVPFCFINGKEASDVPDDIILCGLMGLLTPEFVSSLGKTPPEKLLSLLKKTDTTKPVWGAMTVPDSASSRAPKSIRGWLDPSGTGNLNVTFSFASREALEASDMKGFLPKLDLSSFLQYREEGNDVILSLVKSNEPFAQQAYLALTSFVTRARNLAKQAIASVRLRGLGTAIILYEQAEGEAPANWEALLEKCYAPASSLHNPLSGNPRPTWNAETKTLKGKTDYVLLDFSSLILSGLERPDKTLLAYAKPEIYKEYSYLKIPALFADGHVAQMDAALLEKYIAGTKAVLEGKPLPELPPIPQEHPAAKPARRSLKDTSEFKIRCYCLEAKKEFDITLTPEDVSGFNPTEGAHIMSPYTKKRTGVPMTLCPKCKKWFVPDYYKNQKKGEMQPQDVKLICPHCKTDLIQWYRDHRKKRSASGSRRRRPRTMPAEEKEEAEAF